MSKNEVIHVVRRDSFSKEVPGEREGPPQGATAGDSIPGAWAVPAEAASGLPRSVDEAKGAPIGMIALVVIAVGSVLGGLYWMNTNPKSTEVKTVASSTTPSTLTPSTAPTASPTSPPPPTGKEPAVVATTPDAPLAPSISMDSKPATEPDVVAKVDLKEPVVAPRPAEEPVVEEQVELPVQKKAKAMNRRAERAIEKARYRTAARLLSDAIKLDPTYAPLQRNLGVARARLGNVSGARKAYEAYIRLAPEAPDAPDVRRILGQ